MVLPCNAQNLPQVAMVEDVQLLTYSSCTLPGLASVYGCRDDEGGVEIQMQALENVNKNGCYINGSFSKLLMKETA